jgi:hypothetical protein
MAAMDNHEQIQPGLNVNAVPFNMDGLSATAAVVSCECSLPDFVVEKPEFV